MLSSWASRVAERAGRLAADGSARRALARVVLAGVQLCVWRFPFPESAKVLRLAWSHPELMARLFALKVSALTQAVLGIQALVWPLVAALLLARSDRRALAPRATASWLALDGLLAVWSGHRWQAGLPGRWGLALVSELTGTPRVAQFIVVLASLAALVWALRLGRLLVALGLVLAVLTAVAGERSSRLLASARTGFVRAARRAAAGLARLVQRRHERARTLSEEPLRRASSERVTSAPGVTPGGTLVEEVCGDGRAQSAASGRLRSAAGEMLGDRWAFRAEAAIGALRTRAAEALPGRRRRDDGPQ